MLDRLKGQKAVKWKIEPKRVPSDDCIITVDGKELHVHADEWVEIIPVGTLRQYTAILRVQNLIIDDSDSQVLHDLCEEVSERLVDWNWTGLDSRKLDKPYRNARVVESLASEELAYLIKILQGETAKERKKDSTPSDRK